MDTPASARADLDQRDVSATVLAVAGARWSVEVLSESPSTNAEAARDPREGRVVVAHHQSHGRGRLTRAWTTPPGTALTFSAVVAPDVPDALWPLLPLVAGLAVTAGVRGLGVDADLKWPNDVLVGERKLCGILVERLATTPAVAVVGIGVNTDLRADELPVPTATSLALEGGETNRVELLAAVLAGLAHGLERLRRDPHAVLADYRSACVTLGRQVEVHLPGDVVRRGRAVDVDGGGRLRVQAGDGSFLVVGAGDVVHVRSI